MDLVLGGYHVPKGTKVAFKTAQSKLNLVSNACNFSLPPKYAGLTSRNVDINVRGAFLKSWKFRARALAEAPSRVFFLNLKILINFGLSSHFSLDYIKLLISLSLNSDYRHNSADPFANLPFGHGPRLVESTSHTCRNKDLESVHCTYWLYCNRQIVKTAI